ncbi:MAG: penicillin-binding protein 2, partial [Lachnospiraceae bacterium]|nr:penicillin-binding protein 2 [Lachnospiraceae bacterium]
MGALIAIIFVLLVLRLYYLMVIEGEYYNRVVLSQRQVSYTSEVIPSRRGDILDADGNLLATSIKVYNLIIDPKVINSYKDNRFVNATIDALSDVYGYNRWELRDLIETKSDKAYVRYARQLSKEEKDKFEEYKKKKNDEYQKLGVNDRVSGVWFEEEYKRFYPNDNLASNVIGFVNNAGESVMGLEQYYDTELSGLNGRKYGYLGDDFELESVNKKAVDGYNIVTTIDTRMQKICEEKLFEWATGEIGSKSASAIIMNPNNGEIYAMASTNGFNLNDPRDLTGFDEEYIREVGRENIWFSRWKNNCVQDTFEPGSTAKIVTYSAAIDENLVGNDATFECKGFIELDDGEHKWRIRCNNRNGHGKLTLMETLTKSCNMSMAELGEMLGVNSFVKYQKTFGFGSPTNIDLPNEADTSSFVFNEKSMGRTDLATNSFGQNFNCTMIQLISAFCSAINGGKYYEPHLVKRIENSNGTYVKHIVKPILSRTISERTSKCLRDTHFETI